VAYASASSSASYAVDVSVAQAADGSKTIIRLKFPQHQSIYYDPVASFSASASAEVSNGTAKNAAGAALPAALWQLLASAGAAGALLLAAVA
jgi:hypothetical protein